MPNTRWRKLKADLVSNKTRTALVVLSIAIGVFAIGTIMGTSTVMGREMAASYQSMHPSSIWMYVSDVDDDLVRSVARMPEVQDAEGRNFAYVRVQVGPGEWKRISLTAPADYDNMHVDLFWPESGAWPPPPRQVLLERGTLDYLGVQVGDTILIESGDGTQREMRVAGLVHDLSKGAPLFEGSGAGYVHRDTLEWMGLPSAYSRIFVIAKGSAPGDNGPLTKAQVTQVAQRVQERLEKSGVPVWGFSVPTPGKHPADEVIQPVFMLLGVLGVLALGLAGFLVLNTISAVMSQHVRHIGIMKAVGARRGQIVSQYLGMVLALGLLALCVALPLGALGAKVLVDYVAMQVNVDIVSYVAPPSVYAAEVAVALAVPVLAAMVPVLAGTRVSAHLALSLQGLGDGRQRIGLIDRLLLRLSGLSRPLLLAFRNTFRRKGRLALTLSTLVLSGAIFVGVTSVHASLMGAVDEAFAYFNHEVGLSFRRPYRISRIEQAAAAHPEVIAAECWGYAAAERVLPDGGLSDSFTIVAPPAGTRMIVPTVNEGRWLLPGDENAIVINTIILKNDPDIKVGDEIVLQISKGSDAIERTWHVVGIVKGVLTGPLAYTNYPYFARTVGRANQAHSVRIQTRTKAIAEQGRIARELEEHFSAQGLQVSSRESLGEIRVRTRNQLMVIINMLIAMSVLFAVVGCLGLMGTMSINVIERTREIGVMRAVGATDRAIERIVIVEGITIALISWLAGGLLAVPLGMGLTQALGVSIIRAQVNFVYSPSGVVLWLALVVALAALASYLPARRASRLTVRDVLAYE